MSTSRTAEVVEVVTIGLPFCAFKIVVALMLFREASMVGAAVLMALGFTDALLNGLNLASLIVVGRRVVSPCALSALTQRLKLFPRSPNEYVKDLGNALDVLLSFSLVAAMVAFGKLGALPADQLAVWNGAVVLNVLGAGLSRFGSSVKRL